jgi:hypothetical protein
MGLCRLPAAAGNELCAAPRLYHGGANQAAVVLFESDTRVSGETIRIGMKGLQKVFNLPTHLRILGSSPFCRSN